MFEKNPFFQNPIGFADDQTNWLSIALPALVAAAILASYLWQFLKKSARKNRRNASSNLRLVSRPGRPDMADPANQLQAISRVNFRTVPLLNREEARLLPILEKAVRMHGNGHRVMAQTSLGELIKPVGQGKIWREKKDAFASINSKRLDFSIINRNGHLVAAIEYQGSGHHQNNAFLRDAVKREAVRRAGARFLEYDVHFDPEDVCRDIARLLSPASSSPEPTAWNRRRNL